MSTFDSIPDHMKLESDHALRVQRRHSFPAPDESSLRVGIYDDIRVEDHGSTSSDCISSVLSSRPMSLTVSSSGGDENLLHTYHTKLSNMNSGPQLSNSCVQPAGCQIYPSVIYAQNQHGYNCNTAPLGIPSVGYVPIAVPPVSMNISMPYPMQQQQIYPIQRSLSGPQDWSNVPLPSASAVPYLVCPQLNNHEIQYASSVPSSTVSTPVFSCTSSPGWGGNYDCVKTPRQLNSSCSPIQYSKPYTDVPPTLDLNQIITQESIYPEKLCCNISMGSISSDPRTPLSLDATLTNSARHKQSPSENYFYESPLEKFQKVEATGDKANLWNGALNYEEYRLNGGSNLFITWSGKTQELAHELQSYWLEVREVLMTSDCNVYNVIFENHPTARKAFTMQQRIGIRMVPPKNSHRSWLRNPSPSFLVKFEARCRLTVKKGKAECHDVVGELLKGCLIIADQLKGNRMRVRCCEGNFMFPGGKTVELKGFEKKSGTKTSFGWISYRSKHSNVSRVIRRSWNSLEDYVYRK